jgi:hypothetical protein
MLPFQSYPNPLFSIIDTVPLLSKKKRGKMNLFYLFLYYVICILSLPHEISPAVIEHLGDSV